MPASGVSAAIVNLTVTRPTASSYLTVYPGGQPLPSTSSLNFLAGETRANRAIVPVGPDGTITIYNRAGTSHVVVDVNGWYTGTGSSPAAPGSSDSRPSAWRTPGSRPRGP